MVEEPGRSGKNVGLMPVGFLYNSSYVFIDCSGYGGPLDGSVVCYLRV